MNVSKGSLKYGKSETFCISENLPGVLRIKGLQLDSGHQIGPEATSAVILIVVSECREYEFKIMVYRRYFGFRKTNHRIRLE